MSNTRINQTPLNADIKVNCQLVNFNLNSGADVTALPGNFCKTLMVKLQPTNIVLLGACNFKLNSIGALVPLLAANHVSVENYIYAVKYLERPLLSRHANKSLNLKCKLDAISSEKYKKQYS